MVRDRGVVYRLRIQVELSKDLFRDSSAWFVGGAVIICTPPVGEHGGEGEPVPGVVGLANCLFRRRAGGCVLGHRPAIDGTAAAEEGDRRCQ